MILKFRHIAAFAALLIVILASGCSDSPKAKNDGQLLAVVGKSRLTRADLANALPRGLASADSARYAEAFIRRWVESNLISEIASTEIETTDIDRMVNDYRNQLIEMEYRRRMAETHTPSTFPEDSLRAYYQTNKEDFVIERPLLQGIYLKVPDNANNLNLIRRLYRSDKQADIDRLEKEVLNMAIHYDYFRDKWVDWDQIERHIPYDFGSNPDTFLKGRDHFETTAGGFVYLLDIKDVLPTGSIMPYENAKIPITERLAAQKRAEYDSQLMSNLYNRSLADGKIQIFVDLNH